MYMYTYLMCRTEPKSSEIRGCDNSCATRYYLLWHYHCDKQYQGKEGAGGAGGGGGLKAGRWDRRAGGGDGTAFEKKKAKGKEVSFQPSPV